MSNRRFGQVLGSLMLSAVGFVSMGCGGNLAKPDDPVVTTPVVTVNQKATTFNFITGNFPLNIPASELQLWTLRGQNNELLVKQNAFGENTGVTNPGLGELMGLAEGANVVMYVGPEFAAKMELFNVAAVEFARLGHMMTIVTTGSSRYTSVIGYANGAPAMAARSFGQVKGVVTGAVVTFRSLEDVNLQAILHEYGHVFGFSHHTGFGMMGLHSDVNHIEYSQIEIDNAAMMNKLQPGILFPGTASSSVASVSFRENLVVEADPLLVRTAIR